MSKERNEVCKFYVCAGACSKGRKQSTNYCQRCNKYEPRTHVKHLNQKKEKLNKIREKEVE